MELREGYTTGTAAAAAAKAGIMVLLGRDCPACIDVPLPGGGRLEVPIERCEPLDADGTGGGVRSPGIRAVVVKDAGDDPDATHMAEIHCLVERDPHAPPGHVALGGGKGVGRVTLPGLPVAVGEPAIQPGPAQADRRGGPGSPGRHIRYGH